MMFNTIEYGMFLPVVFAMVAVFSVRFRWIPLLAASYWFYMAWNPVFIVLILFSTAVDYFCAIWMDRQQTAAKRHLFLWVSLVSNIGLLSAFKYYNLFASSANALLGGVSMGAVLPLHDWILPVGISFYTFQTLSYTIDVFNGRRSAERHFGYFALYVSFFPQLVAGPIERSETLLPQLRKLTPASYDDMRMGLIQIGWGLFKKMVVADRIAEFVNVAYGDYAEMSGSVLWLATIGFGIQIYCDFSGYSDIAIGTSRLFGVRLMTNFKTPYFSKNPAEFWTRWHISLSTWFRDYVYIPLGGSRVNRYVTGRNLIVVFAVSGIWHGSNWTFLIWGLFHGILLVAWRMASKWKSADRSMASRLSRSASSAFGMAVTYVLVNLGWVFFRAQNLTDACGILREMLSFRDLGLERLLSDIAELSGFGLVELWVVAGSFVVLFAVDLVIYLRGSLEDVMHRLLSSILCLRWLVYLFLIFSIVVFGVYGTGDVKDFIYFQF